MATKSEVPKEEKRIRALYLVEQAVELLHSLGYSKSEIKRNITSYTTYGLEKVEKK